MAYKCEIFFRWSRPSNRYILVDAKLNVINHISLITKKTRAVLGIIKCWEGV